MNYQSEESQVPEGFEPPIKGFADPRLRPLGYGTIDIIANFEKAREQRSLSHLRSRLHGGHRGWGTDPLGNPAK